MSYHLEMEKTGKPKIEMPPLPEEPQVQQQELQQQVSQPEGSGTHSEPELETQQQTQEESVEEVLTTEPKVEAKKDLIKETGPKESFRQIREKAERAEREREDLIRKVQELEAKIQPNQPKPVEKDEDLELPEDDWVEAKYLKKYNKKLKEMSDELKSYRDHAHMNSVDARLKSRFPDIDSVVTRDNLSILRESYPELADSLNSNTDLYNKGAAAYTLIKKLGIAQEDNYVEDRAKAQKNAAKPRPLASVNPQQGDSPLSKANAFANGLTPELSKQLWEETKKYAKNI